MIGTVFMGAPIFSLPSLSGPIVFVLVNTIGLLFWFNREKLDSYISLQILIAVLCLATFSLLAIEHGCGFLGKWDPRITEPWRAYLLLLMFPGMSALLHFQTRNRRTET
jgi:hypothetical protein